MKGLSCSKLLVAITVMIVLPASLTYGAEPTSTGRQTATATFARLFLVHGAAVR